ncbi:winged helix-turn-helix domain-containing protein [Streptomyces sp. NPDC029004]|uniref:ArsR/SmtB family transcription factor n=1 Tax=Streptomyces sp. NPDC029004 TaxID=3154490 RepID=UPI0033E45AE7
MHFTTEDLLRTRLAPGPDPLWEAVLSANLLGNADGRAVFDAWRAQTRCRLRGLPQQQVGLIRYLAPPKSDFPDFLTPPQAAHGLSAGIEAVLSTPIRRLRDELAALPGRPSRARPLADGEPAALRLLGQALHAYYTHALAPHWPRIQALIDADRAVRARAILSDGVEALLNSFRPAMRWKRPVLEADYPKDRDIHLDGRGLLLIPSVFCWRNPVTLIDPALPPVLVYPVPRSPQWWTGDRTGQFSHQSLAHLLGASRAAALGSIEDGCTTGELARRIRLAAPTASKQATVLREAGLIASLRQANTVTHVLTPLGAALLNVNSG